jgi:hypothetical protein
MEKIEQMLDIRNREKELKVQNKGSKGNEGE